MGPKLQSRTCIQLRNARQHPQTKHARSISSVPSSVVHAVIIPAEARAVIAIAVFR